LFAETIFLFVVEENLFSSAAGRKNQRFLERNGIEGETPV